MSINEPTQKFFSETDSLRSELEQVKAELRNKENRLLSASSELESIKSAYKIELTANETLRREHHEAKQAYNDLGVKYDKELERWQKRDFEAKQKIGEKTNQWRIFDLSRQETWPQEYGKYFVCRKDGKVHWETWNGSGWAYNGNSITQWMVVNPPRYINDNILDWHAEPKPKDSYKFRYEIVKAKLEKLENPERKLMTEQDLEAIRQIVREEIKDALTVKVQDVTHTVKIEKECSNACDWPRCTLKGCVINSITSSPEQPKQ